MDPAGLITWLRAQLDEDERLARAAKPGPWKYDPDPCEDEVYSVHDGEHGDLVGDIVAYVRGLRYQEANGSHVANWNPTRALDEIKAKREILGDCTKYMGKQSEMRHPEAMPHDVPWISPVANFAFRTLLRLAAPYADRPGYQSEWTSTRLCVWSIDEPGVCLSRSDPGHRRYT